MDSDATHNGLRIGTDGGELGGNESMPHQRILDLGSASNRGDGRELLRYDPSLPPQVGSSRRDDIFHPHRPGKANHRPGYGLPLDRHSASRFSTATSLEQS